MSWLKIIKFTQTLFQDCRFSLCSKRLPKMAGVPKPFQQNAQHLFQDCRFSLCSKRLPKMAGVLKPFQQNAAHFVGFFASHLFTKASF